MMKRMHRSLVAIMVAATLVALASAVPAAELNIRPQNKAAWRAHPADVKAVLNSSAQPLWKQFPERELAPILVEPKGGPIVLFRRG